MHKKLHCLWVLLLCSAFWLPVMGDEVQWTYDAGSPLITNADDNDANGCQFSCDFKAGDFGTTAEGSYSALISEDYSQFFTSAWNGTAPEPDDHPHWLQVDLKSQPQSRIIFTMTRREGANGQTNRPTQFLISVSNDMENWEQVADIDNLPTDESIFDYTSPMIDFGNSYRYIRFAVPKTNGGGSIGKYPYFAISKFQVYEAVEATGYLAKLSIKYNEIQAVLSTFAGGNGPGYYPKDKVDALTLAVDKAQKVIETKNEGQAEAVLNELTSIYEEIQTLAYDFVDGGYYYIVSKNGVFDAQPDVEKAMYADSNNRLYWGTLNRKSGKFAFIVRKLENGNYTIQNAASQKYVNSVADANGNFTDATDTQVNLSDAEDALEQVFTSLGSGQYGIRSIKNTRNYNTQATSNGTAESGIICSWSSASFGEAAWSFEPITDEAVIKELEENGKKQYLADRLKTALKSTSATRVKANDHIALITKEDQLSSNAQSGGDENPGDGSSYRNLIDGNKETIFHSMWDSSFGAVQKPGPTTKGWHNLQVNLGSEFDKIKFHFDGRNNASGWHDNPTHITLYGTNDDVLGASTASADSTAWDLIVDMTQDAYGFPGNVNQASYTSPVIDFGGKSYKYLRFVVKHVSTMDGGNRSTGFASPDVTGVTFNLSEFQVYNGNLASTSEYLTVSGMKEACDAYDKLVAEANEKIASLTASQADIDNVIAAAKAIDDLYVDRDVIDAKLAELIEKGQKAYDIISGSRISLITKAEQLSSNNSSANDGSDFKNLIDGNKNTLFHSYWSTEMQKSDITADDWAAVLESASGLTYTGTGYHNLQVKLGTPVSSFYFEYYGRNSDWHDNPNDIAIYATNDDNLGNSTDQSELDSWKQITELNEGFPEDVVVWDEPYQSPVIELGDSYKYIRFVIKNTTHAGKVDTRIFNSPEVTGVTFNLSEFQMYAGIAPERTQYNYIEGMKEACDAMKALMDEGSKLGKGQMINNDFNDKLSAAIDAVYALYADTTEYANLCKKYNTIISHVSIGEGVGFVDSEEAVEAFKSVFVSAKKVISPVTPTKAQIQEAMAKLEEAYKAFDAHVGKVEAGKWYNILSAAAEGDQAVETVLPAREVRGAALYVTSSGDGFGSVEGDYKYGNQLRWGMDDVKFKEMTVDPDAMWRFVAVPELGDNVYYIQNMRKGSYIGNSNGSTNPYDPYYSDSGKPMPFRLDLIGEGQFNIVAIGDTNNPGAISAGDNARQIRGDMTGTIGLDKRTSWTIQAIDPSIDAITLTYPENSVQVVTLPYSVSNLSAINENLHTYAIHSQVSATELALVQKDDFAAGEPFIMAIGDMSQYEDYHGNIEIVLPLPSDLTAKADTVNGLVGVLSLRTVSGNGNGFIEDAVLKVLSEDKSTDIGSQSGYIVPSLIEAQEGEYDLLLTTEGALGIKQVTGSSALVNVYTVDGKLLKRNVKAGEALKNLKKGIYIIGKKKVSVK